MIEPLDGTLFSDTSCFGCSPITRLGFTSRSSAKAC